MDPLASVIHRCLSLDDIYGIIAWSIRHDGETDEGASDVSLKTLAHLARTCKILHENTLPILWYELTSLAPLMRLLPPDSWSEESSTLRYNRCGPPRTVIHYEIIHEDLLDWTVFRQYARFVRRFLWRWSTTGIDFQFSEETAEILSASLAKLDDNPGLLLPYLKDLSLQIDHCDSTSSMLALLSPPTTLTSFAMYTEYISAWMEFWGKNVAMHDLTELCLVIGRITGGVPTKTADALTRWIGNLQSLRTCRVVVPMTTEMWCALAGLPNLVKIVQSTPHRGSTESMAVRPSSQSPPIVWFPALQEIKCDVDVSHMATSCGTMVGSIQSPVVERLHFHIVDDPATKDILLLLHVALRAPWKASLKAVTIKHRDRKYWCIPSQVIATREILRPLLPFGQVEELNIGLISAHYGILDIIAIADTFPRLRSLSLQQGLVPGLERLRLCDLVTLAVKCKQLRSLDAPVDLGSEIPSEDEVGREIPGPSESSLEVLSVTADGRQDVDKMRLVVFLRRVFPRTATSTQGSVTFKNFHYCPRSLQQTGQSLHDLCNFWNEFVASDH